MTPVTDGRPARDSLESIVIQLFRLLPDNLFSRGFGALSELNVPVSQRATLYREYARLVGANLDEVELDLEAYPTLNAFFTRKLKPGLRPIEEGQGVLVSPVDGRLSQYGPITDGSLTQVKDRSYSLRDLLNDDQDAARFEGGHFATIYLSPKDYHRIHWPIPARLTGYRYEPGHLFPVFPMAVRQVDQLFCVNERVIVFGEAEIGQRGSVPIAVIMVGATCVGRITLAFDELSTNARGVGNRLVMYEDSPAVQRGDELATFNLGSTVILLLGTADMTFEPSLEPDQIVRLGRKLGTITG